MVKLLEPDKIENIRCEDVTEENYNKIITRDLIEDMYKFYSKLKGVGLAGVQVGYFFNFFVMFNDEKGYKVILNPKYSPTNILERNSSIEGCLSLDFGNSLYEVKRYPRIQASWFEYEKNRLTPKISTLEKMESIVFQHETDHCNGKTIRMFGKPTLQIG